MDNGEMLEMLARAECALGHANAVGLLNDSAGWNTLDVDYEPPRVERLWREFEKGRLYLHRIHPCEKALYHPHPWPRHPPRLHHLDHPTTNSGQDACWKEHRAFMASLMEIKGQWEEEGDAEAEETPSP